MKALFIVNPIAGKGRGLEFVKSFEPLIRDKMPYHIELTNAKGEATEIAKRYTSQEDYIVFAVGGDGTINEVANGIVGTGSSLAILPTGSGNDFIRSVYDKYTLAELLEELLDGTNESIDVIQINEKYFLNIASLGLDADVVYNARAYKQKKFIKSDMAYIISLVKTLLGPKGTNLTIMVDGKQICDEEVLLLAMANGVFYGGGIPIMPEAKVNDGLVDLCLIRERRITKLIKLIPSLIKATHTKSELVEVYHAKEVFVEAKNGCRVNIDGEIVVANEVHMNIVPNGIQIRVPSRHLVAMEA